MLLLLLLVVTFVWLVLLVVSDVIHDVVNRASPV